MTTEKDSISEAHQFKELMALPAFKLLKDYLLDRKEKHLCKIVDTLVLHPGKLVEGEAHGFAGRINENELLLEWIYNKAGREQRLIVDRTNFALPAIPQGTGR